MASTHVPARGGRGGTRGSAFALCSGAAVHHVVIEHAPRAQNREREHGGYLLPSPSVTALLVTPEVGHPGAALASQRDCR